MSSLLHPSWFDMAHAVIMGAGMHYWWVTRPGLRRLPVARIVLREAG